MAAGFQKEETMICVICKNGETAPGTTTFTLTQDTVIVVVKDVPADVCDNCGEAYVDSETTGRLLNTTVDDEDSDAEVVLLTYGRS